MGIRRSKETGNMMAQCDVCFDVIDFEDGETFDEAKLVIDCDGWQTKRNSNGKWINICCDCKGK